MPIPLFLQVKHLLLVTAIHRYLNGHGVLGVAVPLHTMVVDIAGALHSNELLPLQLFVRIPRPNGRIQDERFAGKAGGTGDFMIFQMEVLTNSFGRAIAFCGAGAPKENLLLNRFKSRFPFSREARVKPA